MEGLAHRSGYSSFERPIPAPGQAASKAGTYYWFMTEKKPAGAALMRFLAAASFAYILLMPVSQGLLLVAVFAVMVTSALMTSVIQRKVLTLPLLGVAFFTLLLGILGLLVGADNPGLVNSAGVFVIAPVVYFVSIAALGHSSLKTLLTTCAVMTVISGTYILVYVGGELGVIPQIIPDIVLELTGAGFGRTGDATEIRFYGLSTLAASAPMWLASLMVERDDLLPRMSLRAAAAAAGIAGAMVGGRRAIIVVLVLIPLVAWVVKRSTMRRGPLTLSPLGALGAMAALIAVIFATPAIISHPLVVNTWGAVVSFFTGVSSDASTSQTERNEQADQLLMAWSQSPIWGHGLGAIIPGYSRSDTQPWQFELQYHVLLMQTGVIGVLLALAIAIFVVVAIRRAASLRPDMLSTLTVTLCAGIAMLIANASNPYLQAPAHMWAIFLPLAVLNVMLRGPAPLDVERARLPQPSTLG